MMNYEEIKAMVNVLVNNEDAHAKYKKKCIKVVLNDCDADLGEWEYNNEEAVDAFMKALKNNCIKAEHDWDCDSYTFDGFVVNIGYSST